MWFHWVKLNRFWWGLVQVWRKLLEHTAPSTSCGSPSLAQRTRSDTARSLCETAAVCVCARAHTLDNKNNTVFMSETRARDCFAWWSRCARPLWRVFLKSIDHITVRRPQRRISFLSLTTGRRIRQSSTSVAARDRGDIQCEGVTQDWAWSPRRCASRRHFVSTGVKVIERAAEPRADLYPPNSKQRWILLIFSIKLLVSIFNREIFPYFLIFPDFEPSFGLFVFIFNDFSPGWCCRDCVGLLVAYILWWQCEPCRL